MKPIRPFVTSPARAALVAVAVSCAAVPPALAQDAVVISCPAECSFQRGYAPTVNGQNSVKLFPVRSAGDAQKQVKVRTERIASLPALYREPDSGVLRVLERDGWLGDLVFPSKLRGVTPGPTGFKDWSIEYRQQAGAKTSVAVSPEQLVAVVRGPAIDAAIVEWLKREVRAKTAHPYRAQLLAGAVAFAGGSEEMRRWRGDLTTVMRNSLDLYRTAGVDPSRMEATLAEGIAALTVYLQLGPDPSTMLLQKELTTEHARLQERFAIARALQTGGMHDAFLEKLQQIGLARWSRPALVEQVGQALKASAEAHYQAALDRKKEGQHGEAFDEVRLAYGRMPCREDISGLYYDIRLQLVNKNKVAARPEPESEDRALLEQIVRELQTMTRDPAELRAQEQYARKRIADGERRNAQYLPLQLRKAEFLAGINQLSASREVVTYVERHVNLSREEADQWLDLDARLTRTLATLRESTEKAVHEQIASGEFAKALQTAASGLEAEPENLRLLYWSAVAAAVLRDRNRTKEFVRRYMQPLASDCTETPQDRATMFDLYRREVPAQGNEFERPGTPNWMSGARYAPGEAYYDPISGSFNTRMLSSATEGQPTVTSNRIQWDGFMASSISKAVGTQMSGGLLPQLELQPVYDEGGAVYMKAIKRRDRQAYALDYYNDPGLDRVLAAQFSPGLKMRGWAGNPFFHPFIWNDIFLFELVYDELGRIREAIPVPPDRATPPSAFSERLAFVWEGTSKRLLGIKGTKYQRWMKYDPRGRLMREDITHPDGVGYIQYKYQGDTYEIVSITCEDKFYDRAKRLVKVQGTIDR